MPPRPGEIYQHYKGGRYQIIAIATHTETQESLVVYSAISPYADSQPWARPLEMFTENTVVDGINQPRFVLLSPRAIA